MPQSNSRVHDYILAFQPAQSHVRAPYMPYIPGGVPHGTNLTLKYTHCIVSIYDEGTLVLNVRYDKRVAWLKSDKGHCNPTLATDTPSSITQQKSHGPTLSYLLREVSLARVPLLSFSQLSSLIK